MATIAELEQRQTRAGVRVYVLPVGRNTRAHIFELGASTLCGSRFLGNDITSSEAEQVGVCKRCKRHDDQFPCNWMGDERVLRERAANG